LHGPNLENPNWAHNRKTLAREKPVEPDAPRASAKTLRPRQEFDLSRALPKNPGVKALVPMLLLGAMAGLDTARAEVHVWEKQELTFRAAHPSANP
jgi:hypothetical protein